VVGGIGGLAARRGLDLAQLGEDHAVAGEAAEQAVEDVAGLGVHALAGVELGLVELVLDAGVGALWGLERRGGVVVAGERRRHGVGRGGIGERRRGLYRLGAVGVVAARDVER